MTKAEQSPQKQIKNIAVENVYYEEIEKIEVLNDEGVKTQYVVKGADIEASIDCIIPCGQSSVYPNGAVTLSIENEKITISETLVKKMFALRAEG